MSNRKCSVEFKAEAVKQIVEHGYAAKEVGAAWGIHKEPVRVAEGCQEARWTTGGARHHKKGRRLLCQGVRVRYACIRDHRREFRVLPMCRVLRVHGSGFYAWLKKPLSDRAIENKRIFWLIRASFLQSGGTYGSPRVHDDLMEMGERLGEKHVARLMRKEGINPRRSYKRRKYSSDRPSSVFPNRLKQIFTVDGPDEAWVTDITYIMTYQNYP